MRDEFAAEAAPTVHQCILRPIEICYGCYHSLLLFVG
jgi:hypothetical protein